MSLAGDDARNALRMVISRLKQKQAEAADRLCPGRTNAGELLKASFPDLKPPEDLKVMWREMNGVSIEGDPSLESLWLDGQNAFLGEEEAVDDYMMATRLQNDEPEFAQYWPKGFVPIASPGDGSRLLINCVTDSPTFGAVYFLGSRCGISPQRS